MTGVFIARWACVDSDTHGELCNREAREWGYAHKAKECWRSPANHEKLGGGKDPKQRNKVTYVHI